MFGGAYTQWDAVENKTSVIVYGVGAVVLLWLSFAVIEAIPLGFVFS